MDSIHEGQLEDGHRLVEALAKALRSEFGNAIDAHPGGVGSEAGAMNRAFRTVAAVVLGGASSSGDDFAAVLKWVLRQTALGRLHEFGVVGDRAEKLLDLEPMLGDAWPAYVALAPASVIDDLTGHTPTEGC